MKIEEYFHDDEGYIYQVQSERDESIVYIVSVDDYDGWYCTCEDYKFRKHKCKHIKRVIQDLYENHREDYKKYCDLKVFVEP